MRGTSDNVGAGSVYSLSSSETTAGRAGQNLKGDDADEEGVVERPTEKSDEGPEDEDEQGFGEEESQAPPKLSAHALWKERSISRRSLGSKRRRILFKSAF